ncbi:unnamed protein product [Nesidiocoris tenuis]|uniref:Uncharacterized protein n=1 Tax=Nesidiocoris tenuis TaxID=355587 RepID=A0A6H5GMQ7_9HEMI|nr:unnamed protein product [Nesidiocoris tenuis]
MKWTRRFGRAAVKTLLSRSVTWYTRHRLGIVLYKASSPIFRPKSRRGSLLSRPLLGPPRSLPIFLSFWGLATIGRKRLHVGAGGRETNSVMYGNISKATFYKPLWDTGSRKVSKALGFYRPQAQHHHSDTWAERRVINHHEFPFRVVPMRLTTPYNNLLPFPTACHVVPTEAISTVRCCLKMNLIERKTGIRNRYKAESEFASHLPEACHPFDGRVGVGHSAQTESRKKVGCAGRHGNTFAAKKKPITTLNEQKDVSHGPPWT